MSKHDDHEFDVDGFLSQMGELAAEAQAGAAGLTWCWVARLAFLSEQVVRRESAPELAAAHLPIATRVLSCVSLAWWLADRAWTVEDIAGLLNAHGQVTPRRRPWTGASVRYHLGAAGWSRS